MLFPQERFLDVLHIQRNRSEWSTRCLCQTSDHAEASAVALSLGGLAALKVIHGRDVYGDALPGQSAYSSLSTIYAAPQTLDTECIFITACMHIHGQVDGAGAGMSTSPQHSAECWSRRRMLIQLYGSCSLVPMATVFALEQKSCIRSLAIKDHCQARERGLPVTKSHQQRCKELLMLIFGIAEEFAEDEM